MQCISIVDAMERYTSTGWGFYNITRPFSIIYYALGGSAYYTLDGEERRFKKGNLYIMPANRVFSLRELSHDKFYALYIHAYTYPEINELVEIDVSLDEFIGDTLRMLRTYVKKERADGIRVLKLTDVLISYIAETKIKNSISLVERVKKHIDENYVEVFMDNDLSHKFNYSGAYISKLFRHEYNITPKQYAKQLVLRDITRMLDEKMAVSEIAGRLGFSSPENLCRFFKSAYGCPPSDYSSLYQKSDAYPPNE